MWLKERNRVLIELCFSERQTPTCLYIAFDLFGLINKFEIGKVAQYLLWYPTNYSIQYD